MIENIIDFILIVSNQVDIANNWDLEGLLVVMGDNNKYKTVIRMKTLLIEKGGNVKNS